MICSIIANPERSNRHDAVHDVAKLLIQKNLTVCISSELAEHWPDLPTEVKVFGSELKAVTASDTVIAIGGDGTMLHTAQVVFDSNKPILGINSGRLGFLADTKISEIDQAFDSLIEGSWDLDERFMLKATSNGSEFFALNEFLFTKHATVSMVTLEVWCDGIPVNKYWADGLIIATPTGSTAYNLSSGGPVILPETEVMVITPISPHTLTTRPLVIGANKKIRVRSIGLTDGILFSNDGKICEIDQKPLDIEITKSDFTVKLIKLKGRNYFETLRSKLMWGLDIRD